MASSIIHMCVANEINKKLKKDNDLILLGSIAPDISKLIGWTKKKSHFIDDIPNVPNLSLFLSSYKNYLNDDFVLGYYIHLYTDYLWVKTFLPNFYMKKYVNKLDGTKVKLNGDEILDYIYNDYNILNNKLIKYYNLDISIFDKKIVPKKIIKEIEIENIDLILNVIKNQYLGDYDGKETILNMKSVNDFISFSYQIILSDIIKKLK